MTEDILKGKTVFIAGGTSGIGKAVAEQLREKGARIIVASRSAGNAARGGAATEAHSLDITSGEAIAAVLQQVPRIDHLIITIRPHITPAPFVETDIAEAVKAFDTKFWGAFRLIQQAARIMGPGSSIVLTTGIAGSRVFPCHAVMGAINAALEALCRHLAVELAPVRVNVVSPGFVAPKPAAVADAALRFPLQRIATPAEVAACFIYCLTNPYLTGTTQTIDGGASLV